MQEISSEPLGEINSWLDAFFELRKVLEPLLDDSGKKKVIFFDELSWLATPETEFLNWMGHFWNDWASRQPIMIVLCGSVSSWITQKIVNDRGGLHNRITKYIHLQPFTLGETESFLKSKGYSFQRLQIVRLYMSLGGIPFHYENLDPGMSVDQAIDNLCFRSGGSLRSEFNRLYPALFDDAHHHIAVIKALAGSWKGLDRATIIKTSGIPNGGVATRVLEELVECDFIAARPPYGKKKKGKIYRLIDEYSLFYLRFIAPLGKETNAKWLDMSKGQSYKSWCGYAFENVCLKHIPQIKQAMRIGGMNTNVYSYHHKGTEDRQGLQVDMLMERADGVINFFEIKFYAQPYIVTKEEERKLRTRMSNFSEFTGNKHHVMLAYITLFGVKMNKWSLGLVQQSIILDDLFDPAKPRPVLI